MAGRSASKSGVPSPFGLLRYANDYKDAARVVMVNKKAGSDYSAPAFFLVGHSIELSLKAFLHARRVPLDELASRRFGHKLSVLLDEALRLRIDRIVPLHTFQQEAIRSMSPTFEEMRDRYLQTGTRDLPQWDFIYLAACDLTRCQHDWLLRRLLRKPAALKRIALRGQF